MRDEEEIRQAFALSADAADELEEDQPAEAAGPYILMKGLAWVLEDEAGEGLYDDLEEEFQELLEEQE